MWVCPKASQIHHIRLRIAGYSICNRLGDILPTAPIKERTNKYKSSRKSSQDIEYCGIIGCRSISKLISKQRESSRNKQEYACPFEEFNFFGHVIFRCSLPNPVSRFTESSYSALSPAPIAIVPSCAPIRLPVATSHKSAPLCPSVRSRV